MIKAKQAVFGFAVLVALALACGTGGHDNAPSNAVGASAPEAEAKPVPTEAGTIGEGTWMVGKKADIRAGTYRSTGAVEDTVVFCNWSIKRGEHYTDSGASEKLNDPQLVTLKEGDEFETDGCAVWAKR